ncbi:hypothetical protein C7S20_10865 [Christiangramia fulva]|uniref:DUF2911 domain-containing protein n=1 Tax=Christiangramia fulva TaxID=2126553 RepID=A0A2R3Z609_9FLAO|nr:DUF2911 domain-containing protein [Christiangramia fulva]AVR45713.1 hypothetical protein C7S20_10865 [Christiangramia fulva]
MGKTIWRILKILLAAVVFALIAIFILRYSTKLHSPEEISTYESGDLKLKVFYNRPYKKGREIFGNLVPYGEVWRTGANEATTFKTNKDILIDGTLLEAGKYTLWTIPGEESWKVIFNSKMYPWGTNFNRKAFRNAKYDALVLEKPVEKLEKPLEQFTITFEEAGEFVYLNLEWDDTKVSVPIKPVSEPSY